MSQTPPAAAPGAPASGTDAIDQLLAEEEQLQKADAGLAEEISADESAEINARKKERDAAAADAARQKAAVMGAAMGVAVIDQILKAAVSPQAAFLPPERDALVGALAPVLAKHNGEPPAWMLQYREEFDFFMVGLGVAVGVTMRVRAAKAAPPPAADDANGEAAPA